MERVLGRLEKVAIDFGDMRYETIAKIDTGADSGAIHVVNQSIDTDENGQDVLVYTPFDDSHIEQRTTDYTRVKVYSSNGEYEYRYKVWLRLHIAGIEGDIELTLADRQNMSFDVIIGWKFLFDESFLVDVSKPMPEGVEE